MIIKQFVGRDKTECVRRALDFWYKNFLNITTLKDFLSKCTWRKSGEEIIVIYRGPVPPTK